MPNGLLLAIGRGIARLYEPGLKVEIPLSRLAVDRPLERVVAVGPRRLALIGPQGALLHDLDLELAVAVTGEIQREDPPPAALVQGADPVQGSFLKTLAFAGTPRHQAAILRDISGLMTDRLVAVETSGGFRRFVGRPDAGAPPLVPRATAYPTVLLGPDRVAFVAPSGRFSVEPLTPGGAPLLDLEGVSAATASPDLGDLFVARAGAGGGRLSLFTADGRGYGAGPEPPPLPLEGTGPRHLLWMRGFVGVLGEDGSIWLLPR
jgi:hypothetical protein